MDVQPESANLQHFKKQGALTVWAGVGVLFIAYMWWEFIYQHFTDDETFRKPLPPPLDFPNPSTTPDTKYWQFSKTPEYRFLYDAGVIPRVPLKIENGKKVYDRFAGVNQPMELE